MAIPIIISLSIFFHNFFPYILIKTRFILPSAYEKKIVKNIK